MAEVPADARLCDDDGMVRRGSMHRGQDYVCTGGAHPAPGVYIRCTNSIHRLRVGKWSADEAEDSPLEHWVDTHLDGAELVPWQRHLLRVYDDPDERPFPYYAKHRGEIGETRFWG